MPDLLLTDAELEDVFATAESIGTTCSDYIKAGALAQALKIADGLETGARGAKGSSVSFRDGIRSGLMDFAWQLRQEAGVEK